MVSKQAVVLFVVVLEMLVVNARGQQRVGPVYPENKNNIHSTPSGYDPFILNWSTGRFDYAPTPYDLRTGPFAFNWHSGHWVYAPGGFMPNDIPTGREPERMRSGGQNAGAMVATAPPRGLPSIDQASRASATIEPSQPSPQVNRPLPAISRRAFNYTTNDAGFDEWYRSTSK